MRLWSGLVKGQQQLVTQIVDRTDLIKSEFSVFIDHFSLPSFTRQADQTVWIDVHHLRRMRWRWWREFASYLKWASQRRLLLTCIGTCACIVSDQLTNSQQALPSPAPTRFVRLVFDGRKTQTCAVCPPVRSKFFMRWGMVWREKWLVRTWTEAVSVCYHKSWCVEKAVGGSSQTRLKLEFDRFDRYIFRLRNAFVSLDHHTSKGG